MVTWNDNCPFFLLILVSEISLPLDYLKLVIYDPSGDAATFRSRVCVAVPLGGLLPPTLARQLVPPVSVHPSIEVSNIGHESCAHNEILVMAGRLPIVEVVEAKRVTLEK